MAIIYIHKLSSEYNLKGNLYDMICQDFLWCANCPEMLQWVAFLHLLCSWEIAEMKTNTTVLYQHLTHKPYSLLDNCIITLVTINVTCDWQLRMSHHTPETTWVSDKGFIVSKPHSIQHIKNKQKRARRWTYIVMGPHCINTNVGLTKYDQGSIMCPYNIMITCINIVWR